MHRKVEHGAGFRWSKGNCIHFAQTHHRFPVPTNFITKMGYLTADKKQELFRQYGSSTKVTVSPESQIALFTYRINHLTEHLKRNRHDFGTQRSLLRLVGKRRKLLDYLKMVDIERYRAIVKSLNLRK